MILPITFSFPCRNLSSNEVEPMRLSQQVENSSWEDGFGTDRSAVPLAGGVPLLDLGSQNPLTPL